MPHLEMSLNEGHPMNRLRTSTKIANLLLVEDNPGDVLLFSKCLDETKLLHRLYVARDGEEAMMFLEHGESFHDSPRLDLIIMDQSIPKIDGFDLLQQVKKNPQLKRIPVIVLTGLNAERDISRSYDLHANCYITKPVELNEYVVMVKALTQF